MQNSYNSNQSLKYIIQKIKVIKKYMVWKISHWNFIIYNEMDDWTMQYQINDAATHVMGNGQQVPKSNSLASKASFLSSVQDI